MAADERAAGAKSGAANVAQLRHAIDSGQTGDKVPFPDIAASPLGTDAEAGGNPATSAEVGRALAQETRPRPRDKDANASAKRALPGVSVGPTLRRPGPQQAPWFIAAGAVLLTALVWLTLGGLGLLP